MSRRNPEFQSLDVTTWPTLAWTELDASIGEHVKVRMQAIERYARGDAVKDIESATGVNRRQLYRMLERGLAPHPDGRIYGYRALIAHVRVADYVRMQPIAVRGERGSRGMVGALSQLLERYPVLAGWLRLQIRQRRVTLEQRPADGELRTRLPRRISAAVPASRAHGRGLSVQYGGPRDPVTVGARQDRAAARLRHRRARDGRLAPQRPAAPRRGRRADSKPSISGGRVRWPPAGYPAQGGRA